MTKNRAHPERWSDEEGMGLLTPAELEAMETTGKLAGQIRRIIGEGPTASQDWAEAAHEIHTIQQRIMSQAAARAYPTKFRLMGSTLKSDAK